MNTKKSNSDLWQELEQIGYFTGQMPENIDNLPDDIFVNIHRYLCQSEDEVDHD
jgi:hypothetical protein